ncbi:MAG: extracellular solute-binding protein [Candidatus Nanopelagicaceae bacterium]|nr:extracellular solute-binding protein [Candidatus Nanopelagicaceae bacterium]
MKITKTLKIAAMVAAVALFAAQPASASVNLTGAGSTFAIPLLDSCKVGFSAATGNTITYSGGGSGAGRSASDKGIGDVNFSDTAHTGATRLATVIHVPILAAPIAVMYNLNTSRVLNLSPETVAGIFGGEIKMWNDPAIYADNNRAYKTVVYKKNSKGEVLKDSTGSPIVLKTVTTKTHLTLPAKKIQVVYRSDSSGTSGNFTAFLHGMAPSVWPKASNGDFKASFPGDINDIGNLGRIVAAAGSPGVAALAGKTPYSITYAEKNFAKAAGLKLANIKNAAGNYQAPDAGGTSDFLGAATVDSSGFLTFDYNTKEPGAYPLGIVSYALVDTKGKNASAVADFLTYLLDPKCPGTDPSLGYTTITGALYALDVKQIAKLR